MTDYAAITDASNTFTTTGLSEEDRALLAYVMAMKAGGLDVVVTATTDHPLRTSSGNLSRHRMAGTKGEGLAIDARMRTRGNDIHRAVFDGFALVETHLHELIYSGAPYSIKAGKRVKPYAVAAHHSHVHCAVGPGTFVRFPSAPPAPAPPPQEDDMNFHYVYANAYYTTNMVHRQHWDSAGPGFTIMLAHTKPLGEVPQDFHDSLVDAER